MATTTGTATDYKNLLEKLRDYITGVDVSPNVSRGWTLLKDTSTASPQPAEFEMHFRGNGDSSPEKQIYFGINTYKDAVSGYYNWDVKGFTGHTSSSPETAFASHPGASPDCYVPLQNTTMTYWFYVTGRRVCALIKTGSAYQFFYTGFIDPFALDSEWPYPMLIMGSTYLQTQKFSDNDIEYASSSNPGGTSTTTPGASHSPGYLRFTDGQWYGVKNYYESVNAEFQVTTDVVGVWPLCVYDTTKFDSIDEPANAQSSFGVRYRSSSSGGSTTANIGLTEDGSLGNPVLYPLTLIMVAPSQQIFGEIHNVYWVSGAQGVTAEDVVTDTTVSPNQTYTVFQNIHRSDEWMFLAVKDE